MVNFQALIIGCDAFVAITVTISLIFEKRISHIWGNEDDNITVTEYRPFTKAFLWILYLYFFLTFDFVSFIYGLFGIMFLYALFLTLRLLLKRLNKISSYKIRTLFAYIYMLIISNSLYLLFKHKENNEFLLTYIGLFISIILIFIIIKSSIFNPYILKQNTNRGIDSSIFGSTIFIIVTIILILYMMVYSTYMYDNRLYYYSNSNTINWFDLLYYTFISFTTIGYGDIHPIRAQGFPLSQIVAILISIMSFVSLSCFLTVILSAITRRGEDGKYPENIGHDEDKGD